MTKAVGVTRIDEPDGESTPALYEFYNVFPENMLMAGNSYDVTIQAFDKKGAEIKGQSAHSHLPLKRVLLRSKKQCGMYFKGQTKDGIRELTIRNHSGNTRMQ